MPDALHIALKEWDLTINSLLAGRQVVLLRKGGILESENQFELEHRQFLFYPTYIHQDPRMVKPPFRENLRQERAEPAEITLRGYGEVTKILEVPSRAALEALDDLHSWDAPLLDMRFAYRPEKPLYLVIVRAFSLPAPRTIKNTLEYAGCKSWVPLLEEIDITHAQPALAPDRMAEITARIEKTFGRTT